MESETDLIWSTTKATFKFLFYYVSLSSISLLCQKSSVNVSSLNPVNIVQTGLILNVQSELHMRTNEHLITRSQRSQYNRPYCLPYLMMLIYVSSENFVLNQTIFPS